MCIGSLVRRSNWTSRSVVENEDFKVFWDLNLNVLCSILVDKREISKIAIPGDAQVKIQRTGQEKIKNHQIFEVIEKLWKLKNVAVVRIVIGGALGAVSDMFEMYTGELNVTIRVKTPVEPLGALWFAPIVIGQAV